MICKEIAYITNISTYPNQNLALDSADVLRTHVTLVGLASIGTAPAPHLAQQGRSLGPS